MTIIYYYIQGRPPSRKKVLLQRYYSDSALNALSPIPVHSFISPSPAPLKQSPRANGYSPRAVPFPSPLAMISSPLAQPLSPRQRTTLRSPVTPRDLRNAAILPPSSPVNKCRVPCSPMGPVGRSLLASPASPRSPIDLSIRPSRHQGIGRSPLASRSLNLPPSPITSTDSNSPKPLPQRSGEQASSPLLRAYLANNKNRIFKPMPGNGEKVTVIGLEAKTTTPPPTPGGPNSFHQSQESRSSELDSFLSNLTKQKAHSQPYNTNPEYCLRLPSIESPMDFSCLLKDTSRTPSHQMQARSSSLVMPNFNEDSNDQIKVGCFPLLPQYLLCFLSAVNFDLSKTKPHLLVFKVFTSSVFLH